MSYPDTYNHPRVAVCYCGMTVPLGEWADHMATSGMHRAALGGIRERTWSCVIEGPPGTLHLLGSVATAASTSAPRFGDCSVSEPLSAALAQIERESQIGDHDSIEDGPAFSRGMRRAADVLREALAASERPPVDPRQPHGESGLFQHEPGKPCVVCDRERPPVDPLREALDAIARQSLAGAVELQQFVARALASPAAPPELDEPDPVQLLGFLILHAEAVHGCEHVKDGNLAAIRPAALRPEGLPDEEGVRNWPGGGGRVSKDALGEPRWSLDPDGAWVVLYAPRQFLDGLRPRLSDTGDTPGAKPQYVVYPAAPRPEGLTKADLAKAIHEAMPSHNIGGWRMRGMARAICSSPNDHLADAAAILARLSDTGDTP